jgi:purine-nucleoside phosphorylase
MEVAALFSVAKYHSVEMASLLCISDSLASLKWDPHFDSKKAQKSLEIILDIGLKSLNDSES